MGTIRVPAVGRQARLGDFYDVNSNEISPSDIFYPKNDLDITRANFTGDGPLSIQTFFISDLWDEYKGHFLGVDALWKKNVLRTSKGAQWLQELLDKPLPAKHARVIVRFVALHRTDSLSNFHIQSNLNQSSNDKQFVVQEIIYGGQVVVLLQKEVQDDTERVDFQNQLFLAAKECFTKLVTFSGYTGDYSKILDQVECQYYTDAEQNVKNAILFNEYVDIHQSLFRNEDSSVWIAQELVLRPLNERGISQRIKLQEKEAESNALFLSAILSEAENRAADMMKDPFVDRIPHLKSHVTAFRSLLVSHSAGIKKTADDVKGENPATLEMIRSACDFFIPGAALNEWLSRKWREIQIFKKLFAGTDVKVETIDEIRIKGNGYNNIYVFHLKAELVVDNLLTAMNRNLGPNEACSFLNFELTSSAPDHLEEIRLLLKSAISRHKDNPKLLIGVTCSSTYPDGTCCVLPRYSFTSDSAAQTPHLQSEQLNKSRNVVVQNLQELSTTENLSTSSADQRPTAQTSKSAGATHSSAADESSTRHSSKKNEESLGQSEGPTTRSKTQAASGNLQSDPLDVRPSAAPAKSKVPDKPALDVEALTQELNSLVFEKKTEQKEQLATDKKQTYDSVYQEKRQSRLAEALVTNSTLHDQGQPSVYHLECSKTWSQVQPLRWFNIGQANDSVMHKTILLMGATGSGKSTLVDAMVNYILGVQWNDPFRFKIVQDEKRSSQAQSQTRCITSYTIHHTKGMQIPYTLTIIDTPGFGDTEGLGRDEQITEMISKFLIHPETKIDDINAICFVASSADTRLTPTQEYIITSVLSIFGRDVKDNIRLLATFTDGSVPPVVEACHAAKFPFKIDPKTGRPTDFYKFNNSVIFASNEESEESTFDKAFWAMATTNFKHFFEALNHLPPKKLDQSKKVIIQRMELEVQINAIKQTLDVCLSKVYELQSAEHRLRAILKQSSQIKRLRSKAPKDCKGYNCNICGITCGTVFKGSYKPLHGYTVPKKYSGKPVYCDNPKCTCSSYDHNFQDFILQVEEQSKEQADTSQALKRSVEDEIEQRSKELVRVKNAVWVMFKEMSDIGSQLSQIGLRSTAQTTEDYVAMLQSQLERKMPEGYKEKKLILSEILAKWKSGKIFEYELFTFNYRWNGPIVELDNDKGSSSVFEGIWNKVTGR